MSHIIVLSSADLDAIARGDSVTVATPDMTFELSGDDHWTGPAFSNGVCRFGLTYRDLCDLRQRIPRKFVAVGIDALVAVTTDEIVA